MPEAVIVATARTPDRPGVQGLAEGRPARRPGARRSSRAALDKVPEPRPGGHRRPLPRLRRAVGRARHRTWPASSPCCSAYDHLPGATVNRFCASSRADHPDGLPRDQGRRGRRLRLGRGRVRLALQGLRRRRPGAASDWHNPLFADGPGAHARRRRASNETWHDPRAGRPAARRLHRHGPDRRERRHAARRHAGARQDEWGVESQNRAEKAIADGFFAREITPVTTARRHRRQRATTARGRASRWRACPALQPVFRADGTVTAGNCCPLNDGAAAARRDERHQGAASSASRRSPGSSRPGSARSRPRSWASARSRRRGRRWPGPA